MPSSDLKRVPVKVDLPSSRELIVAEVARILELGRVQKLTVEVGQPIRYVRLFKPEEMTPEVHEALPDTLYGQIRNAPMEPMPPQGGVFEDVQAAVNMMVEQGLLVSYLVLGDRAAFDREMGFTTGKHLFGIPIVLEPEVPEDVVLVVGSYRDETTEVAGTYKIVIEEPRIVKVEAGIVKEPAAKVKKGKGK